MNFSTLPVTPFSERSINDISKTSIDEAEIILKKYKNYIQINSEINQNIIELNINNLGDPFIKSNYGIHSRRFEIAVLDWFADLWKIERENYWGYITACGTEGNLQGIYIGRENYPNGILYTSKDSHYSVFKAASLYRMKCCIIKSNSDGTMNISHLKECLDINFPAIINVNIGTTFKGGIDDLDAIIESLIGFQFYIHCDGAFAEIMLSFMDNPNYLSFKDKPIGSISVSGHKFIGSSDPCGVIITRLKHIKVISSDIKYINSRDATIMGSRNGQAAICLWYALVKKGNNGLLEDVQKCISGSQFLYKQLKARGIKNVLLNKWSSTVVFKIPKDTSFIKKWQLACTGDICHIVVMPNTTIENILDFLDEYN